MGFFDKVQFPNNAIYNVKTKEGGSKCSGSAELKSENCIVERKKENATTNSGQNRSSSKL